MGPSAEVLSPHRPPAPPTEYFQFNVGGYDTANLLRANAANNATMPELQGFIGCVRGLKIGDNLIDLASIAEENIAHGKCLCVCVCVSGCMSLVCEHIWFCGCVNMHVYISIAVCCCCGETKVNIPKPSEIVNCARLCFVDCVMSSTLQGNAANRMADAHPEVRNDLVVLSN